MPFVSQLEPEALVRHFLSHPPDGFNATTSIHDVPMFTAPFDLLTTADEALQRKVRGLPMYRWWGRMLRPTTRFVGTTVSEYALLPGHVKADRLAADIVQAHGREHAFVIVKDIPVASPLLSARANAWTSEFAEACQEEGFVLVEGQALAWVPIDFDDLDGYLAQRSRNARRDIRRKLRARAQLDVEVVPTGDERFSDPAVLAEFFRLYESVFAQSEIHFDRLTLPFFRAVLQDGSSGGVVFVYRHEGRMIGWNLCFVHDDALVDKYVGFAYPQAREFNLYAVSWMHNLEYALEHGLKRYVAGWTDPEVKVHLGARITFTRHAVRPRQPLLRMALRRMAHLFESDRRKIQEHESHASGRT